MVRVFTQTAPACLVALREADLDDVQREQATPESRHDRPRQVRQNRLLRITPSRDRLPRGIVGCVGADFGSLLPGSGWTSLLLMFIVSVLPIAAAVSAAIIGVVRYRRHRTSRSPAELPAAAPISIESRLAEIDHLLVSGRIDEDEHAAMRSRILDLR